MEQAEKEITSAYEKIINKYAINTEEIIIGGFSAGGVASLETIFRGDIPFSIALGIILLSIVYALSVILNYLKRS